MVFMQAAGFELVLQQEQQSVHPSVWERAAVGWLA